MGHHAFVSTVLQEVLQPFKRLGWILVVQNPGKTRTQRAILLERTRPIPIVHTNDAQLGSGRVFATTQYLESVC